MIYILMFLDLIFSIGVYLQYGVASAIQVFAVIAFVTLVLKSACENLE